MHRFSGTAMLPTSVLAASPPATLTVSPNGLTCSWKFPFSLFRRRRHFPTSQCHALSRTVGSDGTTIFCIPAEGQPEVVFFTTTADPLSQALRECDFRIVSRQPADLPTQVW